MEDELRQGGRGKRIQGKHFIRIKEYMEYMMTMGGGRVHPEDLHCSHVFLDELGRLRTLGTMTEKGLSVKRYASTSSFDGVTGMGGAVTLLASSSSPCLSSAVS